MTTKLSPKFYYIVHTAFYHSQISLCYDYGNLMILGGWRHIVMHSRSVSVIISSVIYHKLLPYSRDWVARNSTVPAPGEKIMRHYIKFDYLENIPRATMFV